MFSYVEQAIPSDPAISNTQGKQKLVRYIKGSLYPNVYQDKSIKGKRETVRYSGGSLHPPCSIYPSSTVSDR